MENVTNVEVVQIVENGVEAREFINTLIKQGFRNCKGDDGNGGIGGCHGTVGINKLSRVDTREAVFKDVPAPRNVVIYISAVSLKADGHAKS